MKRVVLALMLLSAAGANAHADPGADMVVGAVIGAGAGALLTPEQDEMAEGAIVGAMVGAIAGALLSEADEQPQYSYRYNRHRPPYRHYADDDDEYWEHERREHQTRRHHRHCRNDRGRYVECHSGGYYRHGGRKIHYRYGSPMRDYAWSD